MNSIDGKPECKLIGQDSNVFNLIGLASRTLEQSGLRNKANEMVEKTFKSSSYDEALQIISQYVEIV